MKPRRRWAAIWKGRGALTRATSTQSPGDLLRNCFLEVVSIFNTCFIRKNIGSCVKEEEKQTTLKHTSWKQSIFSVGLAGGSGSSRPNTMDEMVETWGKTKIIHCSYVRTYKTLLNIISGKRSYGGSRCVRYLGMVRVQFPAPCWFGAGCFNCLSFCLFVYFFQGNKYYVKWF